MRKIDLYLLLKNRHRNRTLRSQKTKSTINGLAAFIVMTLSLLIVAGLFFAGYMFARFSRDLPSIEILPVLMDRQKGELLTPTSAVDRSGSTTLFTYQEEGISRKFLSIDPQADEYISPQLVRAVTAVYDPDFWSNPGYRFKNLLDPQPDTIAERLVSDLVLWGEAPSPARAIRMRLLAGQVVSVYGRTRVIEWYLNSAWFGRYVYGAESAAQFYFGKSAQQLTLAESALLTSVLGSPALNPVDAPQTAFEMQRDLLRELLSSGAIRKEEYALAVKEKIILRNLPEHRDTIAEGFIRQVEKQLEPALGLQRLQRGGLVVTTTLDADLQKQLVCTATTQLMRVQYSNLSGVAPEGFECDADLLLPTQGFSGLSTQGLAAAGIVTDPTTGQVLAYLEPLTVSGRRLNDSGYQPGSLLTPIVAFSAFSRGYSPASLVWDIPIGSGSDGSQDNIVYHGPVSLRGAIANNYLSPLEKLINEIGAVNIWRSAELVGLDSMGSAPDSAEPLLDGSDTSLMQLATAYSTFANMGVRRGKLDSRSGNIVPETVLGVSTVNGRVILEQAGLQSAVILDEPLAYLVNNVLSDESARWPSLGYPNELETGETVAAKVGSADAHHQVWTVGYNPQRVVLIWMGTRGEDGGEVPERVAAGLWHAIYKYTTSNSAFTEWSVPQGITAMKVCSPSGMLPTADCPNIVTDVFLYGNEPTMPDTLYTTVEVNRETGLLATVFTPSDIVEERTYLNVPAEARAWAQAAGIELPPQGYDTIQVIRTDPQVNISQPGLFSAVSGRVVIRGSANIEDLASYQIQVGEGINPQTWQQVGSQATEAVEDGTLGVWDTTDLNGLYVIRLTVIDTNNLLRSALTQVTVDNTPPSASITYPEAGSQVQAVRGGVTLNAVVDDQVGIREVEWWVDGKLVLTQTTTPFVFRLIATGGEHSAYMKVRDTAGNTTITETVDFKIVP